MANALQSRGQHVLHKAAHKLDAFQAHPSLAAVLVGAAALGAMPVAIRVVLPVAVAAGIAGKLLATQRCSATGHNRRPGFGLGRAQSARCQIRSAKLAQRISQGGCHGRCCRLGWALQLGQARQQVQRIDALWRAEPPARWMRLPVHGSKCYVFNSWLRPFCIG